MAQKKDQKPQAPVRTNKSNELLKKLWAQVKTWNLGVKVILVLVILGVIVKILEKL